MMNQYNDYGQFNGSILVADGEIVIFKKGYGLANMEWDIPNYTSRTNFFEDFSHNSYTVDEFVKLFCSDGLEFEPGSKYSYSNSGYFLLGAIIE